MALRQEDLAGPGGDRLPRSRPTWPGADGASAGRRLAGVGSLAWWPCGIASFLLAAGAPSWSAEISPRNFVAICLTCPLHRRNFTQGFTPYVVPRLLRNPNMWC